MTLDPLTNQLVKTPLSTLTSYTDRKSEVFKPFHNLPTMTLEEFAEIERREAIERSEREKIAEINRASKPQRYEILKKKGLEDDAKLVDMSSKVDEDWDRFR